MLSQIAAATQITIVNMDSIGEGFNDPTPAVPVGGNPATTVGEQRLKVFEYAAKIWSSVVNSNVEILVESNFDVLTCSATSGVLGSAGPTTAHRNFSGAPFFNTYYPGALANALSGVDLSTYADISATFNSIVGSSGCLSGLSWYYGLDGNAPPNTIDLLHVIEHEIAHGLGFLTFVNLATGQKFNARDDMFMLKLEDHSLGITWNLMSDAQRLASSTDTADLHWVGGTTTTYTGSYSGGVNQGHFRMYAPNPQKSGSSVSHFDTALTPNELMEPAINPGISNTGLTRALFIDIGWPTFSNFRPIIGDINDTASTAPIEFVVDDHDDPLSVLTFSFSSSNPAVIGSGDFSVAGSGKLRTLQFTPSGSGSSLVTITVSDGQDASSTSFVLTAANSTPTVTINSPADNADYRDTDPIDFAATASDPEDGDLGASVQWSSSIDGALGSGASLQAALSPGTHTITATVTDSGNASAVATITVNSFGDSDADGLNDLWELTFFGDLSHGAAEDYDNDGAANGQEFADGTDPTDAAPTATITAPASGFALGAGDSLNLAGSASDTEDGDLSPSLSWWSDIDGNLGVGATLAVSLSVGTHTISATVVDSAGATPLAVPSVQVQVAVRDGDVNDDGSVDVSDLLLLQRHLAGLVVLDPAALIRADVYPPQGDSSVTVQDAFVLRQIILAQ